MPELTVDQVQAIVATIKELNPPSMVRRFILHLQQQYPNVVFPEKVLAGWIQNGDTRAKIKIFSARDFLSNKYPPRTPLLVTPDDRIVLRHPSVIQVHAWRGVGKTNFAMSLVDAIANASGFLRWKGSSKKRVLYIEGEQPAADLQEQFEVLASESDNFFIATLEDQSQGFPKIVTPEGREAFEQVLSENQIDVVVFDSLSTLANVSMNDEEAQLPIGDWFIRLRTVLKITVIYLQHDGKAGQQRGHSKHEDWVDTSIHLTWPDDYKGADGLKARLSFDKARRPIPECEDIIISLEKDWDGPEPEKTVWMWSPTTTSDNKRQKAADLVLEMCSANPDISNPKLIAALKEKGWSYKKTDMLKMIASRKELAKRTDELHEVAKKNSEQAELDAACRAPIQRTLGDKS